MTHCQQQDEQAEKHYCLLLQLRFPILILQHSHSTPEIPAMNMATGRVRVGVLLELAVEEPWQSAAVFAELAEFAEVGELASAGKSTSCVQS